MIIPVPTTSHRRRVPVKLPAAPAPPPATPSVVSVVVDTFNNTADVTFSQAVTWDGSGNGSFTTGTGGGSWTFQLAPNVIRLSPNCGTIFYVGESWSWDEPDTSLSPTPDPTQTGFCT